MDEIFEHISDNHSKQSRYEIDLFLLENGHHAEDIEKGWQKLQHSLLPPAPLTGIRYFLEIVLIQIPRNFRIYLAFHLFYVSFWLLLSWVVFLDVWIKVVAIIGLIYLCKRYRSLLTNFVRKQPAPFGVKQVLVRVLGVGLVGWLLFLQGTLADIESYFPGFADSSKIASHVGYERVYQTTNCFFQMRCGNSYQENCSPADIYGDAGFVQKGWVINSTGLPYPVMTSTKGVGVGYKNVFVQYNNNCIVEYISGGVL